MRGAMKNYLWASSGLMVVTTAASAFALDLQGSDRLAVMTRSIIQTCGTTSLGYAENTSNGAEASMLAGTQLIAPMARFLGSSVNL